MLFLITVVAIARLWPGYYPAAVWPQCSALHQSQDCILSSDNRLSVVAE